MADRLTLLIKEINKRGCFVSSIVQVEHQRWYASIRKHDRFSTGNGCGETLLEAVEDAWFRYVDGDAWNKNRKSRCTGRVRVSDNRIKRIRAE